MTGSSLSLYTPQEQVALAADIWPLANRLASTEFVPKPLRDRPEAVMAAMLKGSELGIPLMQALSSIYVIEGKPTMSAELMRAVVLSKGHEIFIEESNSTRCIVVGRRAGKDRDQRFMWTLDDARAAGLLGKGPWKSYPAAMLLARATGVLCRAVFADCLAGISYTREELEDGEETVFDPPSENTTPAPTKKPTAKARQAATRGATPPADEPPPATPDRGEIPPLPGEEDIIDAEIVTTAIVTPRLTKHPTPDNFPPYDDPDPPIDTTNGGSRMTGGARIGMLMNQHGVSARADKQRAVAQLVGHPVESTNDLTPDETVLVIEYMNTLNEGEPFPWQRPNPQQDVETLNPQLEGLT